MIHKAEYLVVDTTAFIQNANLQDIGKNIISLSDVVDEVKSKRQLRRLVVLPYDLQIKDVFPENVKFVTEFSKKTGDFPSLSATDIKVMALTYQLEKEYCDSEHLKSAPTVQRSVTFSPPCLPGVAPTSVTGFHEVKKKPNKEGDIFEDADEGNLESCDRKAKDKFKNNKAKPLENEDEQDENSSDSYYDAEGESLSEISETENENNLNNKNVICNFEYEGNFKQTGEKPCKEENVNYGPDGSAHFTELIEKVSSVNLDNPDFEQVLVRITDKEEPDYSDVSDEDGSAADTDAEDESDGDWITPQNIKEVKKQLNSDMLEEKPVVVGCITTDFAMQNVLKQIGLNVLSLDGRVIKHLRTFILRCYCCAKTTSIMSKVFCPHCGNKSLKKVSVTLDENGEQKIHINPRIRISSLGKKFSLPRPKGGQHAVNPILVEDQRIPQQRATRLANTKNDPLDPDYIAGFSPFVMRDVNSRSAVLGIRNKNQGVKYWMRKNPNEVVKNKRK